jgi:hypothetical protein
VVVGFPGTIADELQLFFGPADQAENKDLPTSKLYYLSMVLILVCCPPELELVFRPKPAAQGR